MEISKLQYLISQNDRNAFDRFYHLYYEQVFRFSYYIVKDKNACSEVVTNVFLAIWKSRNKFAEVSNIETYLYVVTKNEARRFLNNNKNYMQVSLDEIPMHVESTNNDSPDNSLLIEEIELLLGQVVSGLPEKCRLIFLMIRQEGLTPKEIAQILSINESTVRVQLKIAIDKIVEKLKPHLRTLLIFLFLFLQ